MNFIIYTFQYSAFIASLMLSSFLYASDDISYKYACITPDDIGIASLEHQFYHLFKTTTDCNKVRTLVIDPGHGGKDYGCNGHGAVEKHICLSLGLQLKSKLEQAFPDIKVVMTRETDVFIPLHQRAKIANDHHADLFISIHCNSSSANPRASGSESYVLGLHRAKDNLQVAKRENKSILLEEDYKSFYGGFDPNAPETHILLSMYQNVHLEQSILLADLIEKQSRNEDNRSSRGVKQAGFAVLRLTTMPSILFETGFLSNKKDAAFLKSKKGKAQTVNQLLTAVKTYRKAYEKDCMDSQPEPILVSNKAEKITSTEDQILGSYWTIQLAAVSQALDRVPNQWLDLPTIYHCTFQNCTKYYAGKFLTKEDMVNTLANIKKTVSKDAFAVPLPKEVSFTSSDN